IGEGMSVTRIVVAALMPLLILPRLIGAQAPQTPFFMTLPPNVVPNAVGSNGWVSVGFIYDKVNGMHWMPSTGTEDIGGIAAMAISRDGKTIVGNAFDNQGRENAAIWTGGKTWRLLGSLTKDAQACDRNYSATFGASGDASVIVGLAWDTCKVARAFRWEEKTGVVNLGSLSGESTRANAISAGGQANVGWDQHAHRFPLAQQ